MNPVMFLDVLLHSETIPGDILLGMVQDSNGL